jgi:hypothetical protein
VVTAPPHESEVGPGQTDIAQQMVVQPHQVAYRLVAFRTAEQSGKMEHRNPPWFAGSAERAYAVLWMNVL